jgi:hypothetical protein
MNFAAVVRPVIDRVFVSMLAAAGPVMREAYGALGLAGPGMETRLYPAGAADERCGGGGGAGVCRA